MLSKSAGSVAIKSANSALKGGLDNDGVNVVKYHFVSCSSERFRGRFACCAPNASLHPSPMIMRHQMFTDLVSEDASPAHQTLLTVANFVNVLDRSDLLSHGLTLQSL